MERLDRFMRRAAATYYATHDPFADFTTAPEISQMFGELLGAWFAEQWLALGSPDPVRLVELGPGRGTLMADILRTIGAISPALAHASRPGFVETSPRLLARLAERFPEVSIHPAIDAVPDDAPMLLVANEFLDALPIREFVRRADGWTERHVQQGAFVEQPASDMPGDPPPDLHEGDILVCGQAARDVVASLAARAAAGRAVCLLIDYGGELDRGSTLQALQAGRPVDPLGSPGEADLTAHVDFAALVRVARRAGAATHGPAPQGLFLSRLGLHARAAALAPRDAGAIAAAARLAQPEAMGVLFKALAVTPLAFPVPAGFQDER